MHMFIAALDIDFGCRCAAERSLYIYQIYPYLPLPSFLLSPLSSFHTPLPYTPIHPLYLSEMLSLAILYVLIIDDGSLKN